MTDPELMSRYVTTLTEKVRDNKTKGLTDTERRLAEKLVEHQNEARSIAEDISLAQETIRRAQGRVDNLTRRHLQLVSTSAGIAESLISMKFGDEIEKEEKEKQAKKPEDGKSAPAPKPPHKKRGTGRKTK